jgi:hypothetical protein
MTTQKPLDNLIGVGGLPPGKFARAKPALEHYENKILVLVCTWLGGTLWRALRLDRLLERLLPEGREAVPWATMAAVLVLARLCEPSSELHIAEDWYRLTCPLGTLIFIFASLAEFERDLTRELVPQFRPTHRVLATPRATLRLAPRARPPSGVPALAQ